MKSKICLITAGEKFCLGGIFFRTDIHKDPLPYLIFSPRTLRVLIFFALFIYFIFSVHLPYVINFSFARGGGGRVGAVR